MSGDVEIARPRSDFPALFTSTSNRPNLAMVLSINRCTSLGVVTSVAMPERSCDLVVSWSTVAASRSGLRAAMTTLAWALENALAISKPRPADPPVTITTLSFQ